MVSVLWAMWLCAAQAKMRYSDCGLHGQVPVNVSFDDDSRCTGALSDWDASRCILRSSLTLALHNCGRSHVEGSCKAREIRADIDGR